MRTRFLTVTLAALCGAGGCALNNPDNTPLLTALDKEVAPRTTWGKISLGVVFVPVGAVCGVLDVAVVHPAHSVVLAAGQTWRDVWAARRETLGEQIAFFVPKVVFTPIVFAHRWIAYSLFDVPRPAEKKP